MTPTPIRVSPGNLQPGDPVWFAIFRIVERHVGALAAIVLVPLSWPLFWLCLASYMARMFAIEAIYHRYFSHRAFRAGRPMQLLLALLGAQSGQRGPLWWSSKHRTHHQHVETEFDPHSPVVHGFTYAYIKWIGKLDGLATDLNAVPDHARFPELRWINRYYWIPYYGGGLLVALAGYLGWFSPGIGVLGALLWGFYVPSAIALHSVALINTLGHGVLPIGSYRSFNTSDKSRNRPVLALLTLGAGWHNNHHRFAASARAGFRWYEFDATYYVLRALELLGAIRRLRRQLPPDVLAEMRAPRTASRKRT